MSLLEAEHMKWDEVITEMENNWEYITLMAEQKIVIKEYEFFIVAAKEEAEKNAQLLRDSSNMSMKSCLVSWGL